VPVYKRGDIWWYDFTVEGERFRGSTGARTKDVALKIERREHDAALLGGLHQPTLTLADVADLWFAARKAGRKDARTAALRIQIMLRHIPGATPVADIGPRMITEAMNARRFEPILRGKNRKDTGKLPSNSTINRDMIDSTLRPILRYASRNLEAPVRDIAWSDLRLTEPRGVVTWFTDDQITDWSGQLPAWHRPVLRFILRYGVRLKEAFFSLDAIHDGPAGMDIYTRDRKNGPHVITLLDEDAAEIRARIGRARAAGIDTVWFREMKNGELRPIHWRGFQSASDRALDLASIQARPAHDGRHHAGTSLLRLSGGNLAAVQELLGHEAIQSTMRYAHTSRDDLRSALRHAYATPAEPKHKRAS
jgi:integrase